MLDYASRANSIALTSFRIGLGAMKQIIVWDMPFGTTSFLRFGRTGGRSAVVSPQRFCCCLRMGGTGGRELGWTLPLELGDDTHLDFAGSFVVGRVGLSWPHSGSSSMATCVPGARIWLRNACIGGRYEAFMLV